MLIKSPYFVFVLRLLKICTKKKFNLKKTKRERALYDDRIENYLKLSTFRPTTHEDGDEIIEN